VNGHDASSVVSIVIVTHGTGGIVLESIDAIERHTAIDHEVIVVDNPPDDGQPRTAELLRSVESIRLVEADENLGFSGGNNLGAQHASGDLVCFLNPDVIVGPGWLEPLVAALADPVIGIVAPVLVNRDGSLQEAGQLVYDDGCTAAVGGPEVMPGDWINAFSRDVDYASAACWVVRRDDFLAIGGFDERYRPAYFEDVDYAMRVEQTGQRTRLVVDVPVLHEHGSGGSSDAVAIAERSRDTFRTRWQRELARRPSRPSDPSAAIDNRDRLAGRRSLTIASFADCGRRRWEQAIDDAIAEAARRPRDRVTLLTDRDPTPERADAARRAGLEIVVTPDPSGEAQLRVDKTDNLQQVRSLWRFARPVIVVPVLVALIIGLVVRWLILRSPAGILTADEAYTGIQSFEILGGQFPVVLGGTTYTLPFESYLYAPIAAVLGAHVVLLKLLATVSWALASVALAVAGTRIANRRTGLVAALMCWVTPGALLLVSVTAYSAYSSGMLVSIAAFVLATILIDATSPRRDVAVLFGALAGFGFWLHPMFVASLLPMVLVVLWIHRRRVDMWVTIPIGGLLGCLPFLLWNAVNAWPSLTAPAEVEGTYGERFRGFFVDLMPRAFGLRDLALDWQPNAVIGPVLYVGLLGAIVGGVVVLVRRPGPRSRVLLPAVLVGVFPIMALFENLIFTNDGRYGIIAFPFLLLAIAIAVDALMGRHSATRVLGVAAALALVWVIGLIVPTAAPLVDDTSGDPNASINAVVDRLDQVGIDRIYGSYWAVHPIDFVGDRDLTGAVFPFWPIRFPDRQRIVGATPPDKVAVLYLTTDEDPAQLLLPVEAYERSVYGDFVLYVPTSAATTAGN
jgi:GT2 family glycosyltransferase